MTARHPLGVQVTDVIRDALTSRHAKAEQRKYSEQPVSVTGFDELGCEAIVPIPRESVHKTAAMKQAARALFDDKHATDAGRAVRDLLETNGLSFNHHDFAIVLRELSSQLDLVNERGYDYSMVLGDLEEAEGHMGAVFCDESPKERDYDELREDERRYEDR